MISRYKKGEELKEQIFITAKNSFLENGYKKTTISGIAETLGIQLGNLTYYYPKKKSLLLDIYSDFTSRIIKLSNQQLTNKKSALLEQTNSAFIYYLSLLCDETTAKFHYDMLSDDSLASTASHYVVGSYALFNVHNYDQHFLSLLIKADQGARRELLISFLEQTNFRPTEEEVIQFASNIMRITCRLFEVDSNLTEENIRYAKKNAVKFDYSSINLLK